MRHKTNGIAKMRKVTFPISKQMTACPLIADKSITIDEALNCMTEYQVRHFPVVEGDQIVGLVSERDLEHVRTHGDAGQLRVEDVMVKDPYTVAKGTPLSEVARVMSEHRIGSAIIVDHRHHVVGIFTHTDGMRVLSEITEDAVGKSVTAKSVETFLPPPQPTTRVSSKRKGDKTP